MYRKIAVPKLALLSISSFIGGIYYQKLKQKQFLFNQLTECNSLPIFDTVFAASPFSPSVAPQEKTLVNRVSQIMKYGFPGLDNVRSFDDFVLSYDRRNRVAHWVFEHITADRIKHNDAVDRGKCEFKPDESIHPFFRYFISKRKNILFNLFKFLGLIILITSIQAMIGDI